MTIQVRLSDQRGYFDYEWLQTYHTFSFAKYDDPTYRGSRSAAAISETQTLLVKAPLSIELLFLDFN